MSARFDFATTRLQGLHVVRRKPLGDHRGFFSRFYCAREFEELGLKKQVAQINHTLTAKQGAVRGLHFQRPPFAETKVVSCLRGRVFDVAVDLRAGSSTFLQWHAEVLSAENHTSLVIPEGFAHGFQALTPDVELLYLHSEFYEPGAEGALNVRDPRLGIAWPHEITELSDRDQSHGMIDETFEGIPTP